MQNLSQISWGSLGSRGSIGSLGSGLSRRTRYPPTLSNRLTPLSPLNLTASLALIIFVAGAMAGPLGIALGLGGGIFLVPFLTLALGFPLKSAAAISLT